MIDYQAYFQSELGQLRQEGNYRVFVDLKRQKGAFQKPIGAIKARKNPLPSGVRMIIWAWANILMLSQRCMPH